VLKPKGDQKILEISAERTTLRAEWLELWSFRDLIGILVGRELKGRYRQMALGPAWIILVPVLNVVVFTVIFGRFAGLPSDGSPYVLFSLAGVSVWTGFATAVTRSASSLVNNMALISKVYFPRAIVVIAAAAGSSAEMGAAVLAFFALGAFYGVLPTARLAALPAFMILALAFALGLGLSVAALSVRFRDVGFGVGFAVQLLMYASPVVYPTKMVPSRWRPLFQLNPMTSAIDGFRWCLLPSGAAPDPQGLAVGILIAVGCLWVGIQLFRRAEATVVDVL
jgi:lipopolysaccharide transport system permease protein